MSQEEMQQILSQIPPEVLLVIVQLVMNATPEELNELITQLQQAIEQGGGSTQGVGQGRGGAPQGGQGRGAGFQEDVGRQNLYG